MSLEITKERVGIPLMSLEITKERVGIPVTGLTLPHFCVCLKPGPGFQTPYVMVFYCFQ
jgi:hypothetical protein